MSSSDGADRATTAKTASFADEVLTQDTKDESTAISADSTRKSAGTDRSSASGTRASSAKADSEKLTEELPATTKSSLAWRLYRNKKAGVPVDHAASKDCRTLSLPEEDFPMPKNIISRLKKNSSYKHFSHSDSRPWYRLRSMKSTPMPSKSLDVPLRWYGEMKKEINLDFSGGTEGSKLSLTRESSSVWHESSVTTKQRRRVNELFHNPIQKKNAEFVDSAFVSDTYNFQRRILPSKELVSQTLQESKSRQEINQGEVSDTSNVNTWTLKADFSRRQKGVTGQSSSRTPRKETGPTPGHSSEHASVDYSNEHRMRDPNINPFAWSHARSIIDLWDICLNDENFYQIGIRSSATDEGAPAPSSGASSSGGGSTVVHTSTAQLNDFPKASLNVRVDEVPGHCKSSDGQPLIEVRSEDVQSNALSLLADHRFKLAMVAVDFDDDRGTGHNIARALGADEELFQGAVAAKTSVQAESANKNEEEKKESNKGNEQEKPASRSGVKIKNKPKTPEYQQYNSGSRKEQSKGTVHKTDILKAMRKQQDQLEDRKRLGTEILQRATEYWRRYLGRIQRKNRNIAPEVRSFFTDLLGETWSGAADTTVKRKHLLSQKEMQFVKSLSYSRNAESLSQMVHDAEEVLERFFEHAKSVHHIATTKREWYTAKSSLMELNVDFQFISAKVFLSEFESPLHTKYRLSRILQAKYCLLDHPVRIYSMLILHRVLESRIYSALKKLREKMDQWKNSKLLSEGSLYSQAVSKIRTEVYDIISATKLDSAYQAIIARAVSVNRALYCGESLENALSFDRENFEDDEPPAQTASKEQSRNQLGILHVWAHANLDEELHNIEELDKESSFETYTAWQIKSSVRANRHLNSIHNDSSHSSEVKSSQPATGQWNASEEERGPKPRRTQKRSNFDKPWREQPTTTKKRDSNVSTVLSNTRSTCTLSKATKLDKEASRFLKNPKLSKHLLHTKDEETVKTATDIAAAWFYSLRPQPCRKPAGSKKMKTDTGTTTSEPGKRDSKSGLLSTDESASGFYSTSITKSDEAMRDFIPRQHWTVESPYVGSSAATKSKQKTRQHGASKGFKVSGEGAADETNVQPGKPSESLNDSLRSFSGTLERASAELNSTLPSVDDVQRQWQTDSRSSRKSSSRQTNRRSAEHAFTQALAEMKGDASTTQPEEGVKEDGRYRMSAKAESDRASSPHEASPTAEYDGQPSHRSVSFPSFESVENIDEPVEIQTSTGPRSRSTGRPGTTAGSQGLGDNVGESRTEVSQQLADVVSKLSIPPRVFTKLLNLIKDDMGMEQSVEPSEASAELNQGSSSSSIKSLLTVREWKELLWAVEACAATITAFDISMEETGKMIKNSQRFSVSHNPSGFVTFRSKEIPSDLLPQGFLQDLQDRGLIYDEPPQVLVPSKSEVMNVLQLPKREEDVDELLNTLSKGFSSKSRDVLSETKQSPQEAKIEQMFNSAAEALQEVRSHREDVNARCRDVRLQRQWFEIELFLREVAKKLVNYATSKYEGIAEVVGNENAKEIYHKDMEQSCKEVINHLNSLLQMRETKYEVFLRETAPSSHHRKRHGGETQEASHDRAAQGVNSEVIGESKSFKKTEGNTNQWKEEGESPDDDTEEQTGSRADGGKSVSNDDPET